MKNAIVILCLFPLSILSQNFILNEIFIGEIKENIQSEPVYLGDSIAFYLYPGERFVCRYAEILFEITLSDGRNGVVKSENVKRSGNPKMFKITYPYDLFPFTKKHTIFGLSKYSYCRYSEVSYWQKYFQDSTDFPGLTLKAYNKDTSAFFSLMRPPFLDSDGSGEWSFNNWKIINSFTDKELAQMVLRRNREGRRAILFGLYPDVTFSPFGEENELLDLYYSTWYPLTWKLHEFEQANNHKEGKEYNKNLKILKKQLNAD